MKLIDKFNDKMLSAKKEKKKEYYLNGIKVLFKKGETLENYEKVLEEYKTTVEKFHSNFFIWY